VARPDAERVEAIDEILKPHAFFEDRQLFAAVLVDLDIGARHDNRLATLGEGGWLGDLRCLVMRTVRLPCAMATVSTRTSLPITIMPDCSSMTTRAVWSGRTGSCSISASNSI